MDSHNIKSRGRSPSREDLEMSKEKGTSRSGISRETSPSPSGRRPSQRKQPLQLSEMKIAGRQVESKKVQLGEAQIIVSNLSKAVHAVDKKVPSVEKK